MISSLFSFSVSASSRRAETEKEKRQAVFVVLDPGRPSLRSVALGYHQAAPLGLRKGEPVVTADAGRPPICFQSLLAQRGCTPRSTKRPSSLFQRHSRSRQFLWAQVSFAKFSS
jgi:hypothetical protein